MIVDGGGGSVVKDEVDKLEVNDSVQRQLLVLSCWIIFGSGNHCHDWLGSQDSCKPEIDQMREIQGEEVKYETFPPSEGVSSGEAFVDIGKVKGSNDDAEE